MKRKTIMKLMALTVATTLMAGSTMSVFAEEKNGVGFNRDDWGNNGSNDDGGYHDSHVDSWEEAWDWMNQQENSEPEYVEPAPAPEPTPAPVEPAPAPVESNNNSYSAPTVSEPSNNGGSSSNNGGGAISSNVANSNATASNTAATTTANTTISKMGNVRVPGYETFVQGGNASSGIYKATHCGDVKAVLQLADADGNAVGCQNIVLAPMADGRYAVAFTTADATATYTVTTFKGDAAYLTRLGIVAVTVNGNVVRDLVAEEAAAQAAAVAN